MKNTSCQHKHLTAFISETNVPLNLNEFINTNNPHKVMLGYTCNDCNESIFLFGHVKKQEIE